MSFFGFDSSGPPASTNRSGSRGIFEHKNPFTEVSNARKLQAFQDAEDEEYVRTAVIDLIEADIHPNVQDRLRRYL